MRILLKAALAHCAGVQNKVLGSFHHLIGVMQTVGAVLLMTGSKNRPAGQKLLSNLTAHDQGRESSQLCGANLKEGSFTGSLQVGRDLKTVTTTTGRPGPRWTPWPYGGLSRSPRGVVFWKIKMFLRLFHTPKKKFRRGEALWFVKQLVVDFKKIKNRYGLAYFVEWLWPLL